MKKLLRIFKKKSPVTNYWTFKKIPFDAWRECQEEGKLYFVRKYINEEIENEITEEDINVWYSLQDEYIAHFQEDKTKMLKLLSLKIKLANTKLDYIKDSKKNRVLANNINELEEQLRLMRDTDSSTSMTLDECKAIVSKHQGYHLPENITAFSFFSILKSISKHG